PAIYTLSLHDALPICAGFEYNALTLADGLFDKLYPKHPNFDPTGNRKAITLGELRTVLDWITKAMEDGSRRVVVDRNHLALVRKDRKSTRLNSSHVKI